MAAFDAFLKALPQAASSPFALIGYLGVLVAFVVFFLGQQKLKQLKELLSHAKSPADRERIIKGQHLTLPRDGLSEKNWLRSLGMKYIFLLLLAILVVVAFIVVTALNNANANMKEVQAENKELKERMKFVDEQNATLIAMLGKLSKPVKPTEERALKQEKDIMESQMADLAAVASTSPEAQELLRIARITANRVSNISRLKQIGQALHNFASANGKLNMTNWRSNILPYIEQSNLQKPDLSGNIFRQQPGSDDTAFVAITGTKPPEQDGTDNRVIVIEYDKPGILWNKNGDLTVDQAVEYIIWQPRGRGVAALRADGSVAIIMPTINLKTLRWALGDTKGDSEKLDW